MPSYRFYVLDETDHILRAVENSAAADEATRRLAANLTDENSIEIWSGSRKIARLNKTSYQSHRHKPQRHQRQHHHSNRDVDVGPAGHVRPRMQSRQQSIVALSRRYSKKMSSKANEPPDHIGIG